MLASGLQRTPKMLIYEAPLEVCTGSPLSFPLDDPLNSLNPLKLVK